MRRTDTGEKVYNFICDYRKKCGYSPSFREIAEYLGLGLSTVNYHLRQLRKSGRITYFDKISRSIVPVKK